MKRRARIQVILFTPLLMENNSSMIRWLSVSIIVASILISGSILYSSSQKAGPANNNGQQNPPGPVKVSMDDDAVLGAANAPVTMIEFSDYECPFCKRHFMEVFPDIKKEYIDTGKVKLVFRDYIAVPSHNPLATSQALAAQCAKELGGDGAYFAYHDAVFTKTTSNGAGMKLSDLNVIAKDMALDTAKFQECLDSQKYKAEIAKDQADGAAAGVNGTPSFFIGKSTADGTIDGTMVEGAQPYAAFKAAIDKALGQ